jgi:heavy metal sensor kinase
VKSIRLSLVVCFLSLLAVALGAASALLYHTAQEQLLAKKESAAQLIEARYKDRCRDEEDRLDTQLRFQAQALARVVQLQFDFSHWRYQKLHLYGMISAQTAPSGYVLFPVWWAQSVRHPLSYEAYRKVLPEVKVNEEELAQTEGQVPEYFQIDSSWGKSYRSQSLDKDTLALDTRAFAADQVFHISFEDYTVRPGLTVHRVILKTPSVRAVPPNLGSPSPPRREHGRGPDGLPFDRGRTDGSFDKSVRADLPAGPPIFIQCAYPVEKRDAALNRLREDRDRELAADEADTEASLGGLRARLWAIASLTFALTALGSFVLVRRGLAPLQRLGDAVSRVSARDFRLPVDAARLPYELRPIAARLTETLQMLKAAFAREKQAAADISHELRTPLAALLTTLEIALRKPRTAQEYREFLEDCQLSGQQLNSAVERLLKLARLDAGVELLRPREVDVGELAEQCAAVVRPLAEARGLTLTVKRDGPARMTADPDKLCEVINNLLHNAIQYNRPSGAVELRVERVGGRLEVAVRDTGIGISAEARPHIFERFYRADRARSDDGLHAGLGLAIVKEYVDLMGGAILVESAEGEGSTFRVQLPALSGGE